MGGKHQRYWHKCARLETLSPIILDLKAYTPLPDKERDLIVLSKPPQQRMRVAESLYTYSLV